MSELPCIHYSKREEFIDGLNEKQRSNWRSLEIVRTKVCRVTKLEGSRLQAMMIGYVDFTVEIVLAL